jgi:hypothetical protein
MVNQITIRSTNYYTEDQVQQLMAWLRLYPFAEFDMDLTVIVKRMKK